MWVFFKPNAFKSCKSSYFIEQLKNLPFVLCDAAVTCFLQHARNAFLNRNNFCYAVQSHQLCLIAQPYSFHTAPHWCFQRVFEIWSFLFFLCSDCPSRSLPPAPTSWPILSKNFILEKQEQVKEQTWKWNPRGRQSKKKMKYGQQVYILWFTASVKCYRCILKRPEDFEEESATVRVLRLLV